MVGQAAPDGDATPFCVLPHMRAVGLQVAKQPHSLGKFTQFSVSGYWYWLTVNQQHQLCGSGLDVDTNQSDHVH